MDVLIKVAGIAVVSAIASIVIKKQTPEIGVVLIVCASAAIMWCSLGIIKNIINFVDELTVHVKVLNVAFAPLIKIIAVSIVSKLAADVCRDAGSTSLASCVELMGCAVAVTLSLPLLMSVIELISSV